MKKTAKTKDPKVAATDVLALRDMVTAMTRLVQRLETVESKIDQLAGLVRSQGGTHASTAHPSGQGGPQQPGQRHDRLMFEAICADCRKICEVPFKPTEARAVYCKPCWAARKSGHSAQVVRPPVNALPQPVAVVSPAPKTAAAKPAAKTTKPKPSRSAAKSKKRRK